MNKEIIFIGIALSIALFLFTRQDKSNNNESIEKMSSESVRLVVRPDKRPMITQPKGEKYIADQ